MTIKLCSLCVMRIKVCVTASSTLSLLLPTNQFTCHIVLFLFSFRLKSASVLMLGSGKASYILRAVCMLCKQLLFVKKSGEIMLCIDFRALNPVTVCDSFPLPRIEEALQAVKAAVWFTSFDLAQGYL